MTYNDIWELMMIERRKYKTLVDHSWFMSTETFAKLIRVRDAAGRPVIATPRQQSEPYTIFGLPVVINEKKREVEFTCS